MSRTQFSSHNIAVSLRASKHWSKFHQSAYDNVYIIRVDGIRGQHQATVSCLNAVDTTSETSTGVNCIIAHIILYILYMLAVSDGRR